MSKIEEVARAMAALVLFFAMAGCKSEEEQRTEWIAFCVEGDFTAKQCAVLYAIRKDVKDAESSASSAAIMSGMAIGLSAGSGGRR